MSSGAVRALIVITVIAGCEPARIVPGQAPAMTADLPARAAPAPSSSVPSAPAKSAAATALHLFDLGYDPGHELATVVGEDVMSLPPAGRYAILSVNGYLGEAELDPRATRGTKGPDWKDCPFQVQMTPTQDARQALGRWRGTDERWPHLVAVGPFERPPLHARLLPAGTALAGTPYDPSVPVPVFQTPPGVAAGAYGFVVDLDGDGRPELMTTGTFAPGAVRDHAVHNRRSTTTWQHMANGWLPIEQCTWDESQLIGD